MSVKDESVPQPRKISHDDDKVIDFGKLEKELDTAVAAEAKYWRENDAKFRAVHQKVASYDEFRDIVLASHLKPLEKDDRLTDMKFTQPWNVSASKKVDSANKPDHADIPQSKEYPTSGQAFVREWRKLNKNTAQQYSYLIELGAERLGNIFKPEIGFGLLGEFAHCLNCELNDQDACRVVIVLEKLSKTNRFKLTVDFLSKKEKDYLNGLFEKLRNCQKQEIDKEGGDKMTLLDDMEKVYGIKK
ncbi:coiled-coil domain-containing protein 103-like [Mercenaria mercenaria]|uniref:coiled-coil domain-containing protein 103-like n=1 Tax=Mercenaria mercenaria TaxID=6596 RepID=UPI00234F1329|nr:coiled-coil domain-containing protein 103-like [Mercenaria mercenaria]